MTRGFTLRERAGDDIVEIIELIAIDQPEAARRFARTLREEFQTLVRNPGFGPRVWRVPKHLRGLRFWPVKGFRNYLILYLPAANGIDVIRVVHGARRLGPILRES